MIVDEEHGAADNVQSINAAERVEAAERLDHY